MPPPANSGGTDPFALAQLHVRRVFVQGIRNTMPMPAEITRLSANGVTDPLSQRYAAWRHSLLLLAAGAFGLHRIARRG